MPITQDRMMTLIKAGIDCDEGRLKIIKAITQAWENVKRGGLSPTAALEGLRMEFMHENASLADLRSPNIIALEAAWFGRFAKINDRERRKKQRKRGATVPGSGPTPHPSTLARIRAVEQREAAERALQELIEFEDGELDARPGLDPSKCGHCGHGWGVHSAAFKGCGLCGCQAKQGEGGSGSSPMSSSSPTPDAEPELTAEFNRFADEDAEEDARIAAQRVAFAAARAKAKASADANASADAIPELADITATLPGG